jgi:hypothetical protein
MDGGVLEVPFDRLNDFYKTYVQCIKSGEQLFVVEQKTEIYNFFLDIDYKDKEELDIDEIKSITLDVCSKIESLGLPCKCLISVAKPKPKEGSIKTGIHFNWPDLPVSQEGAINLRWHIISTLNISKRGDWSQYVDGSVYGDLETGAKGSGFRMPWSHKKGKHSECKGQGCMVCEHSGKLTEGEYLPVFLYSEGGLSVYPTEITVEGLWLSTVRNEREPIDVPTGPVSVKVKKNEATFKSLHTKNEMVDSELSALLETFVRLNMPGQSKSRIKKIFKYKDTYRIETTSKYCENLGRNHNSNHVWFMATKGTICQKCFCRCETMEGRKHGFCRDFSGRSHFLPKGVCDILFSKSKDDTTNTVFTNNPSASSKSNKETRVRKSSGTKTKTSTVFGS